MTFFHALTAIGGLAMFLYGMEMMSESLTNVNQSRMKEMLESLTANPIKGALLGMIITALIQTSSGTTVIVVGLVNSGIMNLLQAASVIMGANVGTTVTAWVLSLASISSSNFFLKMLKPESFCPILAMIGIGMILFSKDDKKHEIGKALMGFSILMFGMQTMADALKPLSEVGDVSRVISIFSNPFIAFFVGLAFTALIQSSSASVGILQSFASMNLVTYTMAFPIILGQNIGTCATAMLSTIGAKRNAVRAALIHLMFNVFAAVLFVIGFFALNTIFKFDFLQDFISPVGIAVFHSIVNGTAVLVLLPLSKYLVNFVNKIMPMNEDDFNQRDLEFQKLDQRLLENPSIALQSSFETSISMFELSRQSLELSLGLLDTFDLDVYEKVRILEDKVDRYEDKLARYMVSISAKVVSEKDRKLQTILLNNIGDFERIADHARNISKSAKEMSEKNVKFSIQAKKELEVYYRATLDMIDKTLDVYRNLDDEKAVTIEPFEEVIDYMNDEIKARHTERTIQGICSIELGFILMDVTTSLERISDHCSNIGVSIITVESRSFQVHDYISHVSKESPEYLAEYKRVREKYKLPLMNDYDKEIKLDKVENPV